MWRVDSCANRIGVGCAGRVGHLPEVLAVLGANLQLRRHHEAAPSGRQALPDYGSHMEEDYVWGQGGLKGTFMSAFAVIPVS